jgi:hypothetical protein
MKIMETEIDDLNSCLQLGFHGPLEELFLFE